MSVTEAPTHSPADQSTDDTPPMRHIARRPFTHALCGYKIRKVCPDRRGVDCVVCADLFGRS